MFTVRCLFPVLLIGVCCGCLSKTDLDKNEKTDGKKGGGKNLAMGNQVGLAKDLDELAKRKAPRNGPPLNQPKVHEHRVSGSSGTVGMMTDRVYNFREIMKLRPDLKVSDKSTTGSFVTNAYFGPVSRISVSTFKHNMDLWRAESGRYPTYKEYISNPKKFRLEMAKLPRWQVWAYDDRTGSLKVLEDPKLKTKIEGK